VDPDADATATAVATGVPLAEPAVVTVLKAGDVPVQELPAAYFLGLPHFVLESRDTTAAVPTLVSVPSTSDGGGFVNPHSLHEWWVPAGLTPAPVARFALGALVKDGQLRAVFPAVDSFTVSAPAASGGEAKAGAAASGSSAEAVTWRNWGLCSVPLAQVLLDADFVPLNELKLFAFASAPAGAQGSSSSSGSSGSGSAEQSSVWRAVGGSGGGFDVQPAINALARVLADPPPQLAAAKGFYLVTVPLGAAGPGASGGESGTASGSGSKGASASSGAFFPLPLGGRLRLYLTDYPAPAALLELRVGAAAGAGTLEVDVAQVASGADSQYLPAAYKPLFQPNRLTELQGLMWADVKAEAS
jgi:hypothetical protein